MENLTKEHINRQTLWQYHQTLIARYYNDKLNNETKIFLNRIIDEISNLLTGPDRTAAQTQKSESQAFAGPVPVNKNLSGGSVAAPKEEEIVISLSDFTDDKGFKVYDPEPSAKRLLTKHSPLVVVKGLLNQLTACRQTAEIGKEWSAHCCVMYQQENVALNELIKEMVALFDVVRSDLIEIHNDSPTGWTIIKLNNIIEKGQALLDKQ